MNVLVINCGSSSIKYQVVDTASSSALVQGKIELLSNEAGYHKGLKDVAQTVGGHRIEAVGHRVVQAGTMVSMTNDSLPLVAIMAATNAPTETVP